MGRVSSVAGGVSLATAFCLCLSCLGIVLGVLAFEHALPRDVLVFTVLYVAVFVAAIQAVRGSGDLLNPLCIVLGVGFVRFSLSGLLQLSFGVPSHPVFRTMRLTDDHWLAGHLLALLGLAAVSLGWHMPARSTTAWVGSFTSCFRMPRSHALRSAARLALFLGLLALLVFVMRNAALDEVILEGTFRRTEVQPGTGKFFYLSFLSIASCVVLTGYLVARRRPKWVAIAPCLVVTTGYWILGGRTRAMTPLAAGLIVLWYARHGNRLTIRGAVVGVMVFVMGLFFFYAGQLYRGGFGLEGILSALSLGDLLQLYLPMAIWVDLGQLHALAGASAMGPGHLGGMTFTVLLWPLSEILGLQGKSPGVAIMQALGAVWGKKWGLHSSLIGDAYLNFNLGGVIVITLLFGVALKSLYQAFKGGYVELALYALAAVYAVRLFFESIDKYAEAFTVMAFALFVIKLGTTLSKRSHFLLINEASSQTTTPPDKQDGTKI